MRKPKRVPQREWDKFIVNNPCRSWTRLDLIRTIERASGETTKYARQHLAFLLKYNLMGGK